METIFQRTSGSAAGRKRGTAIVIVVGFVFLAAAFASLFLSAVTTHMRIASRQVALEKAMYVAEAGVERSVAFIMAGGTGPLVTNSTAGEGSYVVSILVNSGASYGAGSHNIGGEIGINPSNSQDNEFVMILPNNTTVTKDNLVQDYHGYTGSVVSVHLRPKGNGSQNTLIVDGAVKQICNDNTYDFLAPGMTVLLYNDNVNPQGKAMGKWWIAITATKATIQSSGTDGDDVSLVNNYNIVSRGTVQGVTRVVSVQGLQEQTWAKYVLWANNNGVIYFKDGETFRGYVHANSTIYFSHVAGATNPPTFYGKVTSAASTVGPNNSSSNGCMFYDGLHLGVSNQTMATISFDSLKSKAGLILTGRTYLAMSGTNLFVTNSRRGWTNRLTGIPPLMYVMDAKTGTGATTNGDIYLAGTIDGRMTVVVERDIWITNNVKYASDPKTNGACDDALGLIAKRNVIVSNSTPSDLKIYAHIMATGTRTPSDSSDGNFYVETCETHTSGSRPPAGKLNVHGGIVQDTRGIVGWFNGSTIEHGYDKNYTYDTRFAVNPPPYYPPLADAYRWDKWMESKP